MILSLYGISKRELCEKILDFDNIKERNRFNGDQGVVLKPTDIFFYYPDSEKTEYLYKKDTIDVVSTLLKNKLELEESN